MKIYLLCDMEGVAGLWRPEQVDRTSPYYHEGRELLMQDVNAVVAGAFEGGATEVVACDAHGGGGNFLLSHLDPRVKYEAPDGEAAMPSLDSSFSGLIITGQHAKAGTLNGFLDHTMSSMSWFDFRLNGESVGEIALAAAQAGHFGVPLIMVAGDEAAGREAEGHFPGVVTAATKRGLGRNRAHCLPLEVAHALLREEAARAVSRATTLQPWKLPPPITAELTFYRSDFADASAQKLGVERVDARTVRRVVQSAPEILKF